MNKNFKELSYITYAIETYSIIDVTDKSGGFKESQLVVKFESFSTSMD